MLCSDDPAAKIEFLVRGAMVTAVYTTGTFESFSGQPVENRAGAFTARMDETQKEIPAARSGEPLGVGFARFEGNQGVHKLTLNNIRDGWLWLHGLLVENQTPGVVVYNISNGGWWPSNFLWRQPGFDQTLREMKPDYIIFFLTKPDSESLDAGLANTNDPDYVRLMQRVKTALPDAKTLHVFSWAAKDKAEVGAAQMNREARLAAELDAADAPRRKRLAHLEGSGEAILDLREGLDTQLMSKLGWYKDAIHLAQPGGEGIGNGILALFLPEKMKSAPPATP